MKVTEPVGVLAPGPPISATVTVHEMLWATTTEAGHETVVEVGRPPLEETDPLPVPLLVDAA